MAQLTYEKEITGLILIDPYNDFISEGGKIWDRIKGVAEGNQCVPHMQRLLEAARKTGIRVFYAMHRRYRNGDYETWKYIAPIQKAAWSRKSFEYGTWGGEIRAGFEPQPGDVVTAEHWCSSGFANTDLDMQLKKHGIHKVIVMGLIAHTCVEATVRYAAELGYEVTVVKDATASYSDEHMHASLEVNLPNYASAIVTTDEIVAALASPADGTSLPVLELRAHRKRPSLHLSSPRPRATQQARSLKGARQPVPQSEHDDLRVSRNTLCLFNKEPGNGKARIDRHETRNRSGRASIDLSGTMEGTRSCCDSPW